MTSLPAVEYFVGRVLEGSVEVCQHASRRGRAPIVEENLRCGHRGDIVVLVSYEDCQAPNTTNFKEGSVLEWFP
jgi:hypothetical protein